MSERYDVTYSPEALDDLRNIHDYVGGTLRSRGAAKRLLAKIQKSIRSLETMPLRHGLVNNETLAGLGVRKMAVGNYVVLYQVHEEDASVWVSRVVYGRRNLDRVARDLP